MAQNSLPVRRKVDVAIKIHVLERDHYATSNSRFTIRGKGDLAERLRVDSFSLENSIRRGVFEVFTFKLTAAFSSARFPLEPNKRLFNFTESDFILRTGGS